MSAAESKASLRRADSEVSAAPSARLGVPGGIALAAGAGLAAAWVAAGSAGLLAHSLRHALTWLFLAVAMAGWWRGRPSRQGTAWLRDAAALLLAAVAAIAFTSSSLSPVCVLGVALALAILCLGSEEPEHRALLLSALAVAVFGVYHLARTAFPMLWLVADWAGERLGRGAQAVTGQPLWVGATFGGLDFLVTMAVFYVGWLARTAPPRRRRALYGALAILGGHLLYLMVLACAPALMQGLPERPPEDGGWSLGAATRSLLPWNLPALAALLHVLTSLAMLRWAAWPEPRQARPTAPTAFPLWTRAALIVAVCVAAAALPLLPTLGRCSLTLEGKKIVLFEKGFLNWLRPTHNEYGHYSVGMYGMLPTYIESLGARCLVSPELSEEDLSDADVVVLLFPNDPWVAGQLQRLWDFARRGGTVVVFGEHTVREAKLPLDTSRPGWQFLAVWQALRGDGGERFNDVLRPTAMRVAFDSATFAVGGWLHSYEALSHPTTAGIGDERNQFGVVIGASVEARWPAQPILIGRWGWADPGDEGSSAAKMGNHRYDPGERLGDLVLAAEQVVGKGRIIAFGDTSSMVNSINVGSHVFTSRLLAYAADGRQRPLSPDIQAAGLAVGLLLLVLLAWRSDGWRVAAASLALVCSATLANETLRGEKVPGTLGQGSWNLFPDGRRQTPNNLAYIDTTHAMAASSEAWRPAGTMGLELTLMRNGYLTLNLPEFTPERLERAGLLISIAPSREFTAAERRTLRMFVENGRIFILTVGYDQRRGSESLLKEFGFYFGHAKAGGAAPTSEPYPLGHFKSPYFDTGEYRVHVRFHAGWPIGCTDAKAEPVAYGSGDVPLILALPVGSGKVIVVGDTYFATNQNLENEDGAPFEGLRENADFWRWFLTRLRGLPSWVPPKQVPPQPPAEPPAPGAASAEGQP
jgi:hypothetical protein